MTQMDFGEASSHDLLLFTTQHANRLGGMHEVLGRVAGSGAKRMVLIMT